jgi:hypothetical protein
MLLTRCHQKNLSEWVSEHVGWTNQNWLHVQIYSLMSLAYLKGVRQFGEDFGKFSNRYIAEHNHYGDGSVMV